MPPVIRESGAHPCDDQTLETLQDAVQETKRLNSLEEIGKNKHKNNESTYYEIHIENSVTSDSSSISSNSLYTASSSEGESQDDEMQEAIIKTKENIHSQFLQEKVKALQSVVREKDEQLIQAKGQLRRATTSKCDLIVAVRDIERQKFMVEERLEQERKAAQHEKQVFLESRATHEAELMNEIAQLSCEMLEMRRLHKNQLMEKDFEIAQLQEQVRRLKEEHVDHITRLSV